MDNFIVHSLIKPGTMHSRDYQASILKTAKEKHTLACLPTGLGKTPIAILLTAHRLEKFPDSKIMVCAPTKPLTEQHFRSFKKFLNLDESFFQVITGTIKPNEREKLYLEKKLIFATPQTIRNDIENKRLSLKEFSLLVIDEIHHSIGAYSYNFVAEEYLKNSTNTRILGLTASPGATRNKIDEICKNTGIEAVEIKTEVDEDVSPYVKEKEMGVISVELPPSFLKIREHLDVVYRKKINSISKWGLRKKASKRILLEMQKRFILQANRGDKRAFVMMSLISQAIKVEHSIGLLETQGISILEKYFQKLRKDKTKGAQRLLKDKNILNAMYFVDKLYDEGAKHPKTGKLCQIVIEQLNENPKSRIIIFANYRDTVKDIVSVLEKIDGVRPVMLVGQKEGITQKKQVETIKKFESGEFNILIGTSISEEGLDISKANIAIFYEPVPSPLRSIQRRGRVGRMKVGKVIILITKGTRDEAYYWSAFHKEKEMKRILYDMKYGRGLEKFK
ncbi:MAG: DEAD/DEAH box helicase [Candidatus Aenigmarchaeota archaeon]|nr:DEAD/DEAH box helicase [Candidatus Aenigmarchaeota archaeon]